jgi:hypothetical protein
MAYTDGFEQTTAKFIVGKLLKSYNVNPKQLRRDITAYMAKEGARYNTESSGNYSTVFH